MSNYHNSQLQQAVEQWERLQAEKKDLSDAQADILKELKAKGFSVSTVKTLIRLRKMDPEARQEHEALLDLYKTELGMS